ncbi:MAG TPA: glycosyltransferase family 9 protein [Caulobacteraceae bacterium]|nr:glycosyltransferase family 9 protein [Caulobacteraceae bacterium]
MAKSFPILFITATRIGDAVLSSGLIKRLHEEIPNARFTIACGPVAAPLFADVPNLARVIPMAKEKNGAHWLKLWLEVRGTKWGLVVDLRGSATARFLRRQRRAVKKKGAGEPVHKVIEAARVLRMDDDPPAPFLFVSEDREIEARRLMKGSSTPILAMGPAANWVGKAWPVERFARTAMELLGPSGLLKGGRLAIFGGPEDRRAADEVRKVIPSERCIDLTGRIDLLTVHACLKHARLFIGNDSGLMHLAAAAGTPTLGLFGPSDDRLYAPWGEDCRVVRGPRSFEQFKAIDPNLNQAISHMVDLPVTQVVAAARELLAATEKETALA